MSHYSAHGALAALGLSPDASERQVKSAYARRLKTTRPDEDPEGFQALNGLYQAALAAVRQRQETSVMAPEDVTLPEEMAAVEDNTLTLHPVPTPLSQDMPLPEESRPPERIVIAPESEAKPQPQAPASASAAPQVLEFADDPLEQASLGSQPGGIDLPDFRLPDMATFCAALFAAAAAGDQAQVSNLLHQEPAFWSPAVKQRAGFAILEAMGQQSPAMVPETFGLILHFFDLDQVGAPVDPVWVQMLERLMFLEWAIRQADWRGLTPLAKDLQWKLDDSSLKRLRRYLDDLRQPRTLWRTTIAALRYGYQRGMVDLIQRLAAYYPRIPSALDEAHVHFWLNSLPQVGITTPMLVVDSLSYGGLLIIGSFLFLLSLVAPLLESGATGAGLLLAKILYLPALCWVPCWIGGIWGLGRLFMRWVYTGMAEAPPEDQGWRLRVWRSLAPLCCALGLLGGQLKLHHGASDLSLWHWGAFVFAILRINLRLPQVTQLVPQQPMRRLLIGLFLTCSMALAPGIEPMHMLILAAGLVFAAMLLPRRLLTWPLVFTWVFCSQYYLPYAALGPLLLWGISFLDLWLRRRQGRALNPNQAG